MKIIIPWGPKPSAVLSAIVLILLVQHLSPRPQHRIKRDLGSKAMAPKKKLRGGAGVAKTFASGEKSLATASNVESVSPLMQACNACIDSLYSLRHKTDADIPTEGLKELPLDDSGKQYVWPVEHGGTFKDIAQRAWKSQDRLFAESCEMLIAAGILDPDATVDVLKTKFCMVEDRFVSSK